MTGWNKMETDYRARSVPDGNSLGADLLDSVGTIRSKAGEGGFVLSERKRASRQ